MEVLSFLHLKDSMLYLVVFPKIHNKIVTDKFVAEE